LAAEAVFFMEDENGRYVEMANREAISKTTLCFDYLNKQLRIIINPITILQLLPLEARMAGR